MTTDSTSTTLLERLKQTGDKEAWERFVDLYGPQLHEWLLRLGAQPQDAADLVQEVFLVVVKKLPSFNYDRDKSFRGWLRTIATNKWRDFQRRRRGEVVAMDDAGLEQVQDSDELDALWEAEHRQYLVRRALELIRHDFEPTTWQAFWAVEVDGRPVREVAAQLGLTENAVYIAKHRVLRRLHGEFGGMLE